MPDIKIRLYDKDDHMKNKLCYADTDPRFKTFDGKPWTASLAGEFVMYRDTQRRIAVIMFTPFFPPVDGIIGEAKDIVVAALPLELKTLCLLIVLVKEYPTIIVNL